MRKNSYKYGVIVFVYIVLNIIGSVSMAAVTVTDAENIITDFNIGYLYDENSSMTIEEVADTEFSQQIPNQFALGYRSGAAWFKIASVIRARISSLFSTSPSPSGQR